MARDVGRNVDTNGCELMFTVRKACPKDSSKAEEQTKTFCKSILRQRIRNDVLFGFISLKKMEEEEQLAYTFLVE